MKNKLLIAIVILALLAVVALEAVMIINIFDAKERLNNLSTIINVQRGG